MQFWGRPGGGDAGQRRCAGIEDPLQRMDGGQEDGRGGAVLAGRSAPQAVEQGTQCRPGGVAAGGIGDGFAGRCWCRGCGSSAGGFQIEFPASGLHSGGGGVLLPLVLSATLERFIPLPLQPWVQPEDLEQGARQAAQGGKAAVTTLRGGFHSGMDVEQATLDQVMAGPFGAPQTESGPGGQKGHGQAPDSAVGLGQADLQGDQIQIVNQGP